MRKYDYFIGSLQAKAHYAREWMLRAMSVVVTPIVGEPTQWTLRHGEKDVEVYVPNGQNGWEWQKLEGVKPYEIPFIYHEATGPILSGAIENLDRDLPDGTWGDLIFNSRVLCYATGTRIPYIEGPIDLSSVEQIFIEELKDNPPPGTDDPAVIYIKHWLRFGKAIGDLAGYELFVPSVTEKALQAPANNKELRDQLLKENEGQLDDPVVQSKIQNALVKNYVDNNLKGDPSEGFLYKKKSLNTALKRMFLIHGPEAGFEEGGRAKLITNSLDEGLDIKHYPDMVNSLRAGSYYRGALTALAGEDVDLMGRIFQNARIGTGFCGTTETYNTEVSARRLGRTFVINEQPVLITKENLDEYKGKSYGMFSPVYCKLSRGDCCAVCMGTKLAAYPDSVGSMVAEIPSTMMAVMMGSAHAKELKTTALDIQNFLR